MIVMNYFLLILKRRKDDLSQLIKLVFINLVPRLAIFKLFICINFFNARVIGSSLFSINQTGFVSIIKHEALHISGHKIRATWVFLKATDFMQNFT